MGSRRVHDIIAFALGAWLCATQAGAALGAGPDAEPGPSASAMHTSPTSPAATAPSDAHVSDPQPAVSGPGSRVDEPLHATHVESRPLGLPTESAASGAAADAEQDASPRRSEMKTVVALVSVIGVILALAWAVRRVAKTKGGLAAECGAGGRSPAGLISVIGRYPLARGQTLILLRLDRRVLLLSQTWARGGAKLSTLAELTDPEEVASVLVKARDAEGETVAHRFKAIVERLNHEPSERAVTVVPPVAKADWFERGRQGAARTVQPTALAPARVPIPRPATTDGATALRSRLEALRASGGSRA